MDLQVEGQGTQGVGIAGGLGIIGFRVSVFMGVMNALTKAG